MILKFNGNLLDIMGEEARTSDWENVTGLSATDIRQHSDKDGNFSLIRIVNEETASKYLTDSRVTQLTVEEANTVLDTIPDTYIVYSEGLMTATLNAKIADGSINVNDILPEWTEQQRKEFLYNNNVSGIKKADRLPYFKE